MNHRLPTLSHWDHHNGDADPKVWSSWDCGGHSGDPSYYHTGRPRVDDHQV
ncbi:unnamed protein product [Nesidiocoris tenuis]|uniref:Uncharacterized protein n=1 Tax=Nesidiocoris tenuis TaxID=355587 RepID=A0A6H5GB14_9HEMI|nr:unnamed protein product [Nesidiocoris tenuis]